MKKTMIGISFLACGIFTDLALIFSAVTCLPHMTAWSRSYPSKLMFLIFAGKSQFTDGAEGLGLGVFFIFGALLALSGLIILLKEYLSKKNN